MDLSYQELLGDAEGINNEIDIYRKITPGDILETAASLFEPANSATLFYRSGQMPE